jgi:hypothetical protein
MRTSGKASDWLLLWMSAYKIISASDRSILDYSDDGTKGASLRGAGAIK